MTHSTVALSQYYYLLMLKLTVQTRSWFILNLSIMILKASLHWIPRSINSDVVITYKKGIEKTDKTFKKHELISSHTCRRSFCTNQFLKGVPTLLIMRISGHRTEKAFLRYIKIDEEMAAIKMKKFWEEHSAPTDK